MLLLGAPGSLPVHIMWLQGSGGGGFTLLTTTEEHSACGNSCLGRFYKL